MSLRFTDDKNVALYDSVTGRAFGPTFESEDHARDFTRWADENDVGMLKKMTNAGLVELHTLWFAERVDAVTGALRDRR